MIYLNNAASAWPKAPKVSETVAAHLDQMPKLPGRSHLAGEDAALECRDRLAKTLGAEHPNTIALTHNATHALNLAILGLGLRRGDEVVTSITEHNSVLRPLVRLQDKLGLRLTLIGIGTDGSLDETAVEDALRRSPRLFALNHVSNVTGRSQPVATLFARAKEAGAITLLDASQSLGHFPVNVRDLSADIVAFTGHKGLRGPMGTAGLYLGPGVDVEQILVGGTGARSDLRLHPPEMPTRLEAGTPNLPALAGLACALRWQQEQGEKFRATAQVRAERMRKGMRQIPRLHLFGDSANMPCTGIVSFRIDGWNIEETGFVLQESFGIVCRTGLHCAPLIHAALGSAPEGTVRFSPSGLTTESEIDETLAALRRLVK